MTAYGGGSSNTDTGVSSITSDPLNVTGTDLCLVVGIGKESGSTINIDETDVTWNVATPEQMTDVAQFTEELAGYYSNWLMWLDDPTSANDDVTVSFGATADGCGIFAMFFTAAADVVLADSGMDTATSGTTLSVTVGNVASGDMVVDCAVWDSTGAGTAGANQTTRLDPGQMDAYSRAATSTQAGADGGVMSWTVPSISYGAILTALRVPDAGGGGPTGGNPSRLMLTGVG